MGLTLLLAAPPPAVELEEAATECGVFDFADGSNFCCIDWTCDAFLAPAVLAFSAGLAALTAGVALAGVALALAALPVGVVCGLALVGRDGGAAAAEEGAPLFCAVESGATFGATVVVAVGAGVAPTGG